MLEEIINQKREKLRKEILEKYPDRWRFDDKERVHQQSYSVKDLPAEVIEYDFWDELSKEYYWRAFSDLENLQKRGELGRVSEDEISQATELLKKQVYEGKHIARRVPMYLDILDKFGKSGSPIERFITEKDRRDALNFGFWNYMRTLYAEISTEEYKEWKVDNKLKLEDAAEELGLMMSTKDFFYYFDFKEGVKQSVALPEMPDDIVLFSNPTHPRFDKNRYDIMMHKIPCWIYTRFYLFLEEAIIKEMKNNEESSKVRAKIASPLVYSVLNVNEESFSDQENIRRLLNIFIEGDIIIQNSMQQVLGITFENRLEDCLTLHEMPDMIFGVCSKNILDRQKHVNNVWKRIRESKKEVDMVKFTKDLGEYLPTDMKKKAVEEVKQQITSSKEFDYRLLQRWDHLRDEVTPSFHTKIRNQAIGLYFTQRVRPKKDNLCYLANCAVSDKAKPRLKGFVAADMLRRNILREANSILLEYQNAYYIIRAPFLNSIAEYTNKHGQIKLNPAALHDDAFFPNFNAIKIVYEKCPTLFKKD